MAEDFPHICIDRVLPENMAAREARITGTPIEDVATRMAVDLGKTWPPGATLLVSFMDGIPEVQEKVAAIAAEWTRHVNLFFEFGDHAKPDIRISFSQQGSWSFLGTDALGIDQDRPTMNYGWLRATSRDEEYDRVVLHEFGHALGAIHEHQSPAGGVPWDREAVYAKYEGPPNNWSRQRVDINVLGLYEGNVTNSEFDPDSIMLYPVPNSLTVGDFEIGWNRQLSETDKSFMASLYGADSATEALRPGETAVGSIGSHGEKDDFRIVIETSGEYIVETRGRTDIVMALFNEDDRKIAQDDDSGRGTNARIRVDLDPGQYKVRVWHYWPRRTGDYELLVRGPLDRPTGR